MLKLLINIIVIRISILIKILIKVSIKVSIKQEQAKKISKCQKIILKDNQFVISPNIVQFMNNLLLLAMLK